ncbi:MAG: hypothetical protein CMJ64_18665 [Planctomycetaceae bacterium]|nr:hypothetical protein [Planctomycetaceae bacterium]
MTVCLLGLVLGCGDGGASDTGQYVSSIDDLREIAENAYSALQEDGTEGARDTVETGLDDLEEMQVDPGDQATRDQLKQGLNEVKTLLEGRPSKAAVEAKLKALVTAVGGIASEPDASESEEE